jgi:WD40 repeat protein
MRSAAGTQPADRLCSIAMIAFPMIAFPMIAFVLAATSFLDRASAQGVLVPPSETAPILRLESGGHAAAIRRVSVDAARGVVLTASDDRTARLWSLESGALLRTLRPPIDAADRGRLYGAALHPKLPVAAVAGTTGAGPQGPHAIFLFDTETGRLQRRIDARAGDIKRLAWSADGTVLLAAYAGSDGMRAFSIDGAQIFEQSIRGASYGLSVAPDGTTAVATLDGEVHVYRVADRRVEPIRSFKVATLSPVGIALSPDGRRIAVGSFSGTRLWITELTNVVQRIGAASVDVIDVQTGARIRTLSPPSLEEGNLMTVAWSTDGRAILAGGAGYRGNRAFLLIRFDAETGQRIGEQEVASDSILDLAPLPDGRTVFASFDGSWGVAAAESFRRHGSPMVDYVRGPERLALSANGRRVRWQTGIDAMPMVFDFDRRTLTAGTASDGGFTVAPTLGGSSARIEWLNQDQPKFGSVPLRLEPGEVSRSVAMLRNSDERIYGTSQALVRVRPDGTFVWRRQLDAEARALVVSSDGTQIVGAMSDGTLRWWRMRDGETLLTLIAARDRRWVAVTPDGFYDASTGADRLAGWVVTRGPDSEADFYSLSRFRDQFNRPDVIDKVLESGDPARAVQESNRLAASTREQVPEPRVTIAPPVIASAAPERRPEAPLPVAPASPDPVAAPPQVPRPPVATLPQSPPPPVAVPAPPATASPAVQPPPVAMPAPPRPAIPPPAAATPQIALPGPPTPAPPTGPPASAPLPAVAGAPAPAPSVRPTTAPRIADLPPSLRPLGSSVLRVDSTSITVPFAIRSQGAPGDLILEVRVNGRPVQPDTLELPSRLDGDSRGIARLKVDDPDALVQIIASTKSGTSEPLDFRIQRLVQPPAVVKPRLPTMYVLAIGVSEYQRKEYMLQLAAKDARDFSGALRAQAGRRYGEVVVRTLTDRDATRAGILQQLQWLATAGGPGDVSMLFLAGHGINEPGGQYYFLPHDGNAERLRSTGVPESAIRDTLGRIQGKAIFFVDTCFAGSVLGDTRTAGRELSRLANELAASENGVIVFAASTGRQESLEIDALGNGAFTKALIDGLAGAADFQKRGRVTYKQLDAFVSDEVARLTKGRQTPVTNVPVGIPDFEIARLTL